jgi:hypothetical protein
MLKSDLEFFRIIYHFFVDANALTWTCIGITVLVGLLYFRLIFPKPNDFDAVPVDYGLRPNQQWRRLQIILLVVLSVGSGLIAYHQLPTWFPHLLGR